MVLLLRNLQKVVPLALGELQHDAEILLRAAGDWCTAFDVSVTFMSDAQIRAVNRRYHRRNKATDILSFPYHTRLVPGAVPRVRDLDECELGDIYLGVERIRRQLEETRDVTLEVRLRHLMAHGICHLLGHRHNNDQSHAQMTQKEESMLRYLQEVRSREKS